MVQEHCNCPECDKTDNSHLFELLSEVIAKYKGREGSLIQILHAAQNIFGYLPFDVQRYIAEGLGTPISEVSGVVSFYSFFSTTPKGKHTIRVCLGTACYVRGGKKVISRLQELLNVDIGGTTEDKVFTLEVARCIGSCGLAPAMMIDDTVYKQVNPEKIMRILSPYYTVSETEDAYV
jgi:NADH:ubiquinone oxidoreductase subunit E